MRAASAAADALRPMLTATGSIDHVGAIDVVSTSTPDGRAGVPKGAILNVHGWAAIVQEPARNAGIYLRIDDGPPLAALTGLDRADVAASLDSEAYRKSGFRGLLSTAHLAPGKHHLSLAVLDSRGRLLPVSGGASFTLVSSLEHLAAHVTAGAPPTPILIDEVSVDEQPVGAHGTVSVARSSTIGIHGWAIDRPGGGPGKGLYGLVGALVARGVYGIPRDDVALDQGDDRFRDCGFALRIPLDGVPPGEHLLSLRLIGVDGTTVYGGPAIRLQVEPATIAGAPYTRSGQTTTARIDEAVAVDGSGDVGESHAELEVARGDRIFVRGWAIDAVQAQPARAVFVCVDDRHVTAAVCGADRPDVADALAAPQLAPCGFSAILATGMLEPGSHELTLRVIGDDGRRYHDTGERVSFTVTKRD
jgi:hypothetical protein